MYLNNHGLDQIPLYAQKSCTVGNGVCSGEPADEHEPEHEAGPGAGPLQQGRGPQHRSHRQKHAQQLQAIYACISKQKYRKKISEKY